MNYEKSSQLNKKNECYPENDFYSLYRIIGFGSKNNFSLSKNESNGLIAWICGPYIIFYDIISDSQVFFIKNINNKIISCIIFSSNGKLLATGEGNCKNGEICLYNIFYNGKEKNYQLLLSYKAHKYGIDKIFFFKNDKYLLSIGNNEDKIMNIMDIENNQIIYSYIFNKNILGADLCNDFAIICGNNFIKLYEFNFNILSKNSNINNISNDLLIKKSIDLSKLKDKSFQYASIYINKNKKEKKIFFITEDCYLVELKANKLILNRWINLKANKGYNLTIWDNKIGCGCSDGIYRIFNIDNLTHIQTLHKPPPLGPDANNINSSYNNNLIYPDIMCNLYSNYHKKLILVYSNKYFSVWDIKNKNQMNIIRYHIFQCGSIKTIDYSFDKNENNIKIASCSDDKTVIFWNFPLDEYINNPLNISSIQHITYSKYIRHIFYFSNNFEYFKIKNENNKFTKINNNCIIKDKDIINLTSIKFSVDIKHLFIGDSIGNLHIYSLSNNFDKILEIPAHNERINTIDTITINNDEYYNKTYMATGSSDNYVNIFEINNESNLTINNPNTIFEQMSSEVINIIFCIDKNKKLKLIVAENNSNISFYQITNAKFLILQKYYEPLLKTYCLCYSPFINKIISGHNGKIIIWKTSSNIIHKHFQVTKGDKNLDNFRIGADSNGVMFATSNNDKNIRIRALHDGKLLCKIAVAESISNLLFILNDNYLLATSVEGYIYFYKLNQNFISKLKKDKELINSMEEKTVINNKLKLLQKLLENDISLSQDEQVKSLIEKLQKSEDTSFEDLQKLDELVIESKKRGFNNKEQKEEIIQLKEEKPNNSDDQDNQNNNNDGIDERNKNVLSKSKLFEKDLKEYRSNKKIKNINKNYKNNIQNRLSRIDNNIKKYNDKNNKKKKINNFDLNLNHLNNINFNDLKKAKSPQEIKAFKKEKILHQKTYLTPKKLHFGNSFIKTDYKNVSNNSFANNKTNINKNMKKKQNNNISNNSFNNESNFKYSKIIKNNFNNYKNLQNKLSKINQKNNYKYLCLKKCDNDDNKNIIYRNTRFSIIKTEVRRNQNIKLIKKECNFKIINQNNNNIQKLLIQKIESIDVNLINKKSDLKEIENKLELLRDKIRLKLGTFINDSKEEKLLDIFGTLLIDKINKSKNK